MASAELDTECHTHVSSEPTDAYFSSYEDVSVHELMLKDKPRTLAYQQFIEQNAALFQNKIVVDVGAGTGILSLFAAKAGAKHVYAIEASGLSRACKKIVEQNGFADVITVIAECAETVVLPSDVKADVMISEWMGFYLLHESMLNSVITARDRLLAPDGIMAPSTATLFLCPVSMKDYTKEHFDYWRSVYGFDFSPLLPSVKQSALSQPTITTIKTEQCLANVCQVAHFDLQFVTADDVKKIMGNFDFKATKNGVLHGFACWFDVAFEGGETDVILSTGPAAETTHWQQTVMFLPEALLVSREETISCRITLTQDSENMRCYNICIEMDDVDDMEDEDDSGEEVMENGEVREQILQALQS